MTPFPLRHEAVEVSPDVRVDLIEPLRSVAGAEVVAPTAKHRIQTVDDDSHVFHSEMLSAGHLLHALPHALDARHGWFALEEVDAPALLLPDRTAHAFAQ